MKYVETLASYLPSLIVHHLLEHDPTRHPPGRQSYNTVCVFADVSGFTALSEAMAKFGPEGAEHLKFHLNSYFGQMAKLIAAEGGDIFKFAGDAMIVLWPDVDDLQTRARRAGQCALAIQRELHEAKFAEGVTLSVKIGIGVGRVSVLHLGGALGRMEYVAVGEPLVQAFGAEHHAKGGGEVLMSPAAWARVKEFFAADEILDDGFVRLKEVRTQLRKVNKLKMLKELDLENAGEYVEDRLRCYVPGAVLPWLNPESPDQEMWGGDLRKVTVLFVNLGLKEHDLLAAAQYDEAMRRAHDVLVAVQTAVYQYEGSVNKFLMDDKGSTLIAVFGLPPLSHHDDSTRGVLAGLAICARLWDQHLVASVGVTTGIAFCGVVGATSRKEYSVLGDSVNLSARLMQRAVVTGGGVIVDKEARLGASRSLIFQPLDSIMVKGKSEPIDIYRPYPEGIPLPTTNPPGTEPRLYQLAYDTQKALTERAQLLAPHAVAEIDPEAGGSEEAKGEEVAPARGTVGSSGTASERRTSAPAKNASATNGSHVSVRQFRYLLKTKPAPFSSTTTPDVYKVAVSVPPKFADEDMLTAYIDYTKATALAEKVVCGAEGEDSSMTLIELRDAAVGQAKAEGRLWADAPATEFALQIQGSDAFVPLLPLEVVWMAVFAVEYGAITQAVKEGTLRVNLVKRRDQGGLQSLHTRAMQSLLERKIELLATGQGSASMLVAELGMGKTELLNKYVGGMFKKKASVFCVTASQFQRGQPFVAWSELLKAFLAEGVMREKKELTTDNLTAAAAKVLTEFCTDKRLKSLAGLLNPLLGVKLALDGQLSSHALRKLRRTVRDEAVEAMILMFVRAMVVKAPLTLVIDDALYMDPTSWQVALRVAAIASARVGDKGAVPVQFIVSCRPAQFYRDVVESTVAPGLQSLLDAPYVHQLRLSRLPPMEARKMVHSLFYNPRVTISEKVLDFLESACLGCPLMIKEAVRTLVQHRKLQGPGCVLPDSPTLVASVTSGGVAGASDIAFVEGFDPARNMPNCPTVLGLMAYRVDRLTTVQQLILKCGAMCVAAEMPVTGGTTTATATATAAGGAAGGAGGHHHERSTALDESVIARESTFKYRVLYDSFPLEVYKRMLQDECDSLEEMGLLTVTKTEVVPGTEGEPEPVYRFSSWFMRESLRRRMLQEQRKKLARNVEECVEKHKADVRKMYMEKVDAAGAGLAARKQGWLEVRKNVDGSIAPGGAQKRGFFTRKISDWKRRWVSIGGTELRMYRDEKDEAKGGTPLQIIPLLHSTATAIPVEDLNKECAFRIDSRSWVKKGAQRDEQRSFFMASDSDADVEDWVFWIKFLAERLEMQGGRKASRRMSRRASSRTVSGMSALDAAAATDLGLPGVTARGNALVVTVEEARHVLPSKVEGALADPFVKVFAGDAESRTPPVRNHVHPTWGPNAGGTLMLTCGPRQAARANLRFEVWDKDDFNADVLIGVAEFPVRELVAEMPTDHVETPEEAQAKQSAVETRVLELRSAKLEKDIFRGDLRVKVRRIGSSRPAEDALIAIAAAGGAGGPTDSDRSDDGLEDNHPVRLALAKGGFEMSTARARAQAAVVAITTPDMDWLKSVEDLVNEGGAVEDGAAGIAGQEDSFGRGRSLELALGTVDYLLRLLGGRGMAARVSTIVPGESFDEDDAEGAGEAVEPLAVDLTAYGGGPDVRITDSLDDAKKTYLREQLSSLVALLLSAERDAAAAQQDQSSFNAIVSMVDLDDVQRKWLTQEYSQDIVGEDEEEKEDLSGADIAVGEAEDSVKEIGWGLITVDPTGAAPGPEDVGVTPPSIEDFFYTDDEGTLQGPFKSSDLEEWAEAGYFGNDFVVNRGSGDGKKIALGDLLPQLQLVRHVDEVRLRTAAGSVGADCREWDFAIWNYSDDELVPFVTFMFAYLHLPAHFSISAEAFSGFVRSVQTAMTLYGNPYHNFHHAVDVLQTCFVFLVKMDARAALTGLETLSLAVASLCHDLEHPGLNNAYQINAATELALTHNDQSVLENHHCVVAFRIIREFNVLGKLPTAQYSSARKLIIKSILATDMTCHFGLTAELKECANRLASLGTGGEDVRALASRMPPADREVLIKTLLHSADISNPCKPWDTGKEWSDLVCKEFFAQGDREKAEGLPVSPNMDRETTKQAQLSLNFIDFIVAPLFIAVSNILPLMQTCVDMLDENRSKWEEELQRSIAEEEPETKEAEKKRWERRKTAFHQVMIPIAKESSPGSPATPEARRASRRRSLNPLQVFADAASSGGASPLPTPPHGLDLSDVDVSEVADEDGSDDE
mmetsp:Transcript_9271/g.32672  ORF Transcript_9271/g.32672 Transcript_9271/m.32672 type:complete len:2305 (-) Transcript_9271:160-7074(-)